MTSDSYCLISYDDYWRVPLFGRTVSRFQIDSRLSIEFLDPDREYLMITIEQQFCLELEGVEYRLNPENPCELGPVFSILHNTVQSALAYKDGTLKLEFTNGSKLVIVAHPKYEAWGLAGDRGLRIVCLPGGDLAVWKPDPIPSKTGMS
jgi:hypothetical protein